jgi:hypothetical protein
MKLKMMICKLLKSLYQVLLEIFNLVLSIFFLYSGE